MPKSGGGGEEGIPGSEKACAKALRQEVLARSRNSLKTSELELSGEWLGGEGHPC